MKFTDSIYDVKEEKWIFVDGALQKEAFRWGIFPASGRLIPLSGENFFLNFSKKVPAKRSQPDYVLALQ